MEHKTYYQPVFYFDDGTNIEWGDIPEELASFMAFPTREDCEAWLEDNDYDPGDFNIVEYHDDDIEDVTLIDADGYFLDGTGSLSAYNSGEELDREQERLMRAIENRIGDKDRLYFNAPATLYEDKRNILENRGYNPDLTDEDRQDVAVVASVDREFAYDEDGTKYPLLDIVDLDDIEIIYDSVLYDC